MRHANGKRFCRQLRKRIYALPVTCEIHIPNKNVICNKRHIEGNRFQVYVILFMSARLRLQFQPRLRISNLDGSHYSWLSLVLFLYLLRAISTLIKKNTEKKAGQIDRYVIF